LYPLREAGHDDLVRQKTGLVLDAYFSATKWMWLFEQDPALKQRAERGEILAGTIDTWLIWRLTAGRCHVTDVSNASRTLLMNLKTGQWDDELLALFGIPQGMLLGSYLLQGVLARSILHSYQVALPWPVWRVTSRRLCSAKPVLPLV
jgi:glycerol kinase